MVDSPETSSGDNIEATQSDQDGVFYDTFLHYVEFSKYFVSFFKMITKMIKFTVKNQHKTHWALL